jgi:hypothetical protein
LRRPAHESYLATAMLAIATLLLVLSLSLIITRIATVALIHTGLSRELARFQARSAYTGVGFTTAETETVVGHPVRRRIIHLLMLLGNAGIVTVVASLILSFMDVQEHGGWLPRLALLLGGVALLWGLALSGWVDRRLSRVISWALLRWTDLDIRDYANLLQLAGDYGVSELQVAEGDWLAERTLQETELSDEGILVLGIRRAGGGYLGAPRGESAIHAGDTLILYARVEGLRDLDQRRRGRSGDQAHEEAVAEQEMHRKEEAEEEG